MTHKPLATSTIADGNSLSNHTCAIRAGGISPMCWGENYDGQHGNGTQQNFSRVPVAATATLTDVISIGTGFAHTCALRNTGAVVCWGGNYFGMIGDGTNGPTNGKTLPAAVSNLSNTTALSAAPYYNCAVSAAKLWCWGQTPLGLQTTPSEVSGLSNVVDVAAGTSHVCVLRNNGTVACLGSNNTGQLGNGATANYSGGPGPAPGSPASSTNPVTVQRHTSTTIKTDLSGVIAISSGSAHSCALMSDQTVQCWGDNNVGALGNASTSFWPAFSVHTSAVLVDGISGATKLAAGKRFNCVILSDKTVKCWGDNNYGQLGVSSAGTAFSKTPLTISGITDAVAITAGDAHACVLLGNGDIQCWGTNGTEGNLGNNSTAASLTPVSTAAGAVFGQ